MYTVSFIIHFLWTSWAHFGVIRLLTNTGFLRLVLCTCQYHEVVFHFWSSISYTQPQSLFWLVTQHLFSATTSLQSFKNKTRHKHTRRVMYCSNFVTVVPNITPKFYVYSGQHIKKLYLVSQIKSDSYVNTVQIFPDFWFSVFEKNVRS